MEIKVRGKLHHLIERKSQAVSTKFEKSITPSQIPAVIEQLRKSGGEDSWVVFMFYTSRFSINTDDECPNLQFSIQKGKLGLDWVLLGPRNIADKDLIAGFITSKGCKVKEKAINEVSFLRVKKGDMGTLGTSIVEDFYQMLPDSDVGVLASGFSLSIIGKYIN